MLLAVLGSRQDLHLLRVEVELLPALTAATKRLLAVVVVTVVVVVVDAAAVDGVR